VPPKPRRSAPRQFAALEVASRVHDIKVKVRRNVISADANVAQIWALLEPAEHGCAKSARGNRGGLGRSSKYAQILRFSG